jgi:hypothetical protein
MKTGGIGHTEHIIARMFNDLDLTKRWLSAYDLAWAEMKGRLRFINLNIKEDLDQLQAWVKLLLANKLIV